MNQINTLAAQLLNDEAGFIVSAELIIVATICVLALVVGLTEVSTSVNQELEDVGAAIGSINQSFSYRMSSSCKAQMSGSSFTDHVDEADGENDLTCNHAPQQEAQAYSNHNSW